MSGFQFHTEAFEHIAQVYCHMDAVWTTLMLKFLIQMIHQGIKETGM